MKDFPRYALLGAICLVLFFLLLEWNKFSAANEQKAPTQKSITLESASPTIETETPDVNSDVSTDDDIPQPSHQQPAQIVPAPNSSKLVNVSTDVLDLKIDLIGGDIVALSLPTYWAELETPDTAFELLNRTAEKTYVSQSGLVGPDGTDKPGSRPQYSTATTRYELLEGENQLTVDLMLPTTNGVSIIKRFVFTRGEYLIDIHYVVANESNKPWQAGFFGQIKRDASVPKSSATGLQPFLGAATTTSEERYVKMDFEDMEKKPFKESFTGGWMAMVQHYFISAWIGNPDEENNYTARKLNKESLYILGFTGPMKTIAPGAREEIGAQFYAGPKITKRLEEISPYLDLTVDYGWLWWVAKPIHWVLQMIHSAVQNWGWSIVVLTVLIKIILFPLSHKAYISMGHMRKVAPKLASLKEQCGDNRQKLQEEMMRLYKTEKINPLGGCLPMLLQMPVFIALYWVLMESVELRHAPFMGWILDLSVMDPYFCLPILMGVSMYYQQKMNPAPPDPMQAKIMQYLPIIFTFMFLWFPAGLVLYWLVNNIVSMIHQGYINKLTESGKL